MKHSQTSDRVSSKAGKWAKVTPNDIEEMEGVELYTFAADVRSMAASLLRQDEVKGLRKIVRKVLGK